MEKNISGLDSSIITQINGIDFVSQAVLNNPRASRVPKKIDSLFFSPNNEEFLVLSIIIINF